jgi:hypothetical protein
MQLGLLLYVGRFGKLVIELVLRANVSMILPQLYDMLVCS